jgi:hypothetical protein
MNLPEMQMYAMSPQLQHFQDPQFLQKSETRENALARPVILAEGF